MPDRIKANKKSPKYTPREEISEKDTIPFYIMEESQIPHVYVDLLRFLPYG